MPQWTAEQIMDSIGRAIHDRAFEAVPPLLRLLAVRDPASAQAILDVVELARGAA